MRFEASSARYLLVPRPSGLLLVVAAVLVSRGECPLPEVALVCSALLLEGGVLFCWYRLINHMLLSGLYDS
jgi:uncharacterized membrane protein (UPF0136 family)